MTVTVANRPQFAAKVPWLMKKLMADFPFSDEDAAAVAGNGGHESGGFALLQELAPTVKGSKGGFGWFMWTGPRRRAYEAYCKRHGYDPASDEANYKWLFLELSTSEAKAVDAVKAAEGLEAKVKAFEKAYERAGVKHYPSRLAYAELALKLYREGHKAPAAPKVQTVPIPVTVEKPSIWKTVWGGLFGKDAKAETPTAAAEPAITQIMQVQKLLSQKGYVEVGQPDGLDGPKTRAAVRIFRAENGMPDSDVIDDKLIAALTAAGPRKVARDRVEATAQDLREKGNSQVGALDGLGTFGKLLLGLGGIGGVNASGVLDQANDTLSSVQSTFGTITTILTTIIGIVQWCVAHWWLFAIAGGLYVVFRVAMAVLNMVVLFRQGFLARADK